jgi:hypothetical protein
MVQSCRRAKRPRASAQVGRRSTPRRKHRSQRRRVHRHLGICADTGAASIVERRERRVQPADRVNTDSRLGPHHTRATHEPATLLSFANKLLLIGTGRFAACALAPFAL